MSSLAFAAQSPSMQRDALPWPATCSPTGPPGIDLSRCADVMHLVTSRGALQPIPPERQPPLLIRHTQPSAGNPRGSSQREALHGIKSLPGRSLEARDSWDQTCRRFVISVGDCRDAGSSRPIVRFARAALNAPTPTRAREDQSFADSNGAGFPTRRPYSDPSAVAGWARYETSMGDGYANGVVATASVEAAAEDNSDGALVLVELVRGIDGGSSTVSLWGEMHRGRV